jgi:hypothetical protein
LYHVGISALPTRIEIKLLVFDVAQALLPNGSLGGIGFSLCVALVLRTTWGRPTCPCEAGSFFVACPAGLAARTPVEAGATQVFAKQQSKSMWHWALLPEAGVRFV